MNTDLNSEPGSSGNPPQTVLEERLEKALMEIWDLSCTSKGNTLQILAILRTLENLHQKIRDNFFQESLPDNRQSLYALLRDIEAKGGWPYIYRMKLNDLINRLTPDEKEALYEKESNASSTPSANS